MMHLKGYRAPAKNPEHKIQVALVDYLEIALKPEIICRAIPNGGLRKKRVGQQLKAEGVRRGTPDLFFCLPAGRIAWLEMKAAKGGLRPEQKDFRDRVQALDHLWAMVRSVDEAIVVLTKWDVLKSPYRRAA